MFLDRVHLVSEAPGTFLAVDVTWLWWDAQIPLQGRDPPCPRRPECGPGQPSPDTALSQEKLPCPRCHSLTQVDARVRKPNSFTCLWEPSGGPP